jgi:hypothetical protein
MSGFCELFAYGRRHLDSSEGSRIERVVSVSPAKRPADVRYRRSALAKRSILIRAKTH